MFRRNIAILQDFRKKSRTNDFPAMNGNYCGATITMPQEMVTASRANHLKAFVFKYFNDFTSS